MVLMGGNSVAVLRMIVIAVGMGVQRRGHGGGRNQCLDEQRRQETAHEEESMGLRRQNQRTGAKVDPCLSRSARGRDMTSMNRWGC